MSQMLEYIKIALMNIKSNKGRSILTMLGIIIGISSVIMIISIGNGVKAKLNGDLNDLAGGQLYISVNSDKNENQIEFDNDDFDIIKEKIDHVKGVTPRYSMYGTIAGKKGNFDVEVDAGTDSLEFTSSNKLKYGRYFSASEYYAAKKACVITESGAINLFGTTDVLGMDVEITLYGVTQEMTIVGIREDPDSSSIVNALEGQQLTVEVPISTLGDSYGFYVEGYEGFYVISDSAQFANQVAKECINLLEGRFNVRGKGQIHLENFNDSLSQINSMLDTVTLFIVFVAAISLLVGGIGVMNIMLVSVTERTREIGIRKSLGARTSSIMMQFLSESAIITLVGGAIGIILGAGGAILICAAIGYTAKVTVGTVLGATIFSSGVGLFFGIYPARKAAKLSPIEALRHE